MLSKSGVSEDYINLHSPVFKALHKSDEESCSIEAPHHRSGEHSPFSHAKQALPYVLPPLDNREEIIIRRHDGGDEGEGNVSGEDEAADE